MNELKKEFEDEKTQRERFKPVARQYETGKIGFYQALQLAHQMGVEADKWIRIEDRVPNPGEYILTFSETQGVLLIYLSLSYNQLTLDEFKRKLNFTHWQPLPKNPKTK